MTRSAWKRHASIAALCAAPMLLGSPGAALAQPKGSRPPKGAPAAAPAPAAAAPAGDNKAVATALFLKGSDLFKAKKYIPALEQFKQSYAAVPSPNSHLYIARCLAAIGETRSAYVEFTKVIDEATIRAQTEEKYVPTRDSARTEREELAPRLGLVTITVNNADPASTVRLGAYPVSPDQWGKPFPIEPSTVDAVVQTGDRPPVKQTLTIGAGERRALTLDAAGAAGPALVDNTAPPPKTRMSPMRLGAFIATGVGVVGFAMLAGGGVTSSATYSDLKTKCGTNGGCGSTNVSSEVSKGKTQQAVANAGLVLGIVGVGAGVTLFVLSARARPSDAGPSPSAGLVLGPSWAGVKGAF